MIPKPIIEKAIEGGFKQNEQSAEHYLSDAEIVLMPTFWQALGKALGWTNSLRCPLGDCGKPFTKLKYGMEGWMNFAHRFYDLILTGGDTERFWSDLLG